MVKKTLFKYGSVLMSVVLIASTLTACGTNTAYNQTQSEVAISSEAASNTESIISNAIKNELSVSNTSTLKTNTRDEMVYVFGKADGTQDHITVTEKVTDTNGKTTTSQSSSTKSAPVSIKVTYKLNGTETKPEDMIGKSGKVTIRYDYTNNEKKTITVNGKSQTAYVPFTMITGTLLPTDKFSNVEVTNGKVSKVGDNIIALGMTMPGLKDTLNLKFDDESLDMDIPEYFEISADVEDFELDMSMSVATTSVLDDIDTDDFSVAKLEDKMNELQSAADQLTDGTVTLQDGTQTLADSIPALTDGVGKLDDGASSLKDGIYAYTDGATALAAGAGQLKDGIAAYTDGANKLGAGAGQLQTGLSTYTDGVAQISEGSTDLKSGINAYTTGAKQLGAGAAQLKTGVETYTAGVASAAEGAKQVSAGVSQLKTMITETMANQLAENLSYYKTNKNIQESVSQLTAAATGAGLSGITIADDLTALAAVNGDDAVAEKITELYTKYLTAYTQSVIANGATSQITSLYANQLGLLVKAASNQGAAGALAQVASQIAGSASSIDTLAQGASSLSTGLDTLNEKSTELNSGVSTLNDGLVQLNSNDDALNDGIAKLDTGAATLNANSEQLNAGAAQIAGGTATLNANSAALNTGIEQLDAGLTELNGNNDALNTGAAQINGGLAQLNANNDTINDGISQINAGLVTLNGNNDTLNGGIGQLYNGFATLNANNPALRDGSSQLADGTSTLRSSSTTLADGVTQLNDGAITLKDGMAEFNASGIKAITSLVGDDADTAVDTIKEVINLGKNYNTFLGKTDGKDSSVTFVYKMAELTK